MRNRQDIVDPAHVFSLPYFAEVLGTLRLVQYAPQPHCKVWEWDDERREESVYLVCDPIDEQDPEPWLVRRAADQKTIGCGSTQDEAIRDAQYHLRSLTVQPRPKVS